MRRATFTYQPPGLDLAGGASTPGGSSPSPSSSCPSASRSCARSSSRSPEGTKEEKIFALNLDYMAKNFDPAEAERILTTPVVRTATSRRRRLPPREGPPAHQRAAPQEAHRGPRQLVGYGKGGRAQGAAPGGRPRSGATASSSDVARRPQGREARPLLRRVPSLLGLKNVLPDAFQRVFRLRRSSPARRQLTPRRQPLTREGLPPALSRSARLFPGQRCAPAPGIRAAPSLVAGGSSTGFLLGRVNGGLIGPSLGGSSRLDRSFRLVTLPPASPAVRSEALVGRSHGGHPRRRPRLPQPAPRSAGPAHQGGGLEEKATVRDLLDTLARAGRPLRGPRESAPDQILETPRRSGPCPPPGGSPTWSAGRRGPRWRRPPGRGSHAVLRRPLDSGKLRTGSPNCSWWRSAWTPGCPFRGRWWARRAARRPVTSTGSRATSACTACCSRALKLPETSDLDLGVPAPRLRVAVEGAGAVCGRRGVGFPKRNREEFLDGPTARRRPAAVWWAGDRAPGLRGEGRAAARGGGAPGSRDVHPRSRGGSSGSNAARRGLAAAGARALHVVEAPPPRRRRGARAYVNRQECARAGLARDSDDDRQEA